MDLFTCQCGKSFKRQCDVTKHQRYHCRGLPTVNVDEKQCIYCSRQFNTFIGLRQHLRHAHPTEYNDEMEANDNRAYNAWSAMEEFEMATEELAYNGYNINQHLAGIFTHRTLESIKGHRRLKAYKDLVLRIQQDRLEAADDPVPQPIKVVAEPIIAPLSQIDEEANHTVLFEHFPLEDSPVNFPESPSRASTSPQPLRVDSGSPTTPTDILSQSQSSSFSRTTNPSTSTTIVLNALAEPFEVPVIDSVLEYIQQLIQEPSFPPDLRQHISLTLTGNSNGAQTLELLIMKIKERVGRKEQSQPNKKRNSKDKAFRGNAKRAYLYKKAQTLYKTKRAHLANAIIEGTLEQESNVCPSLADIEATFRGIYETPSKEDQEHILDYVDHRVNIYAPISSSEIKQLLNKKMSEAAGLDHLTHSDLRKVPTVLITCLFNLMLYLGETPIELQKCRTTLIPKGGTDLQDAHNWRPITVTSVILRVFNKILAGRFKHLPFHYSQRGFLEIDGTLANTMTLQTAIKSCRKNQNPYCITTLDLKKAFDSVSIYSIKRALERFRIEDKIIKLILHSYSQTTTTITCGPNTTGEIRMLRGVKQGDPLSPLLFNMVIDELLVDLHKLPPGLNFEDSALTTLAYADDLVIFTETSIAAQSLVRKCERFLEKRQMELNASKCTVLAAKLLPGQKKLYIASRSSVYANGGLIPAITIGQQFKYLGYKFSFMGTEKPETSQLYQQLKNICRAPLKPWQKLNLLNRYLLPRYFYILQAPNISMKTLRNCDRSIRHSIKQILHLPSSTPSSFLYAPARSGGLGITCFATKIPGILLRRINNIEMTSDPHLASITNSAYVTNLRDIFNNMLTEVGTSLNSESNYWTHKLETSICGNGISAVGNSINGSSWIFSPPPFWNGRDYISAIQLRGNLLPVKGGVHNHPNNRRCRAGCDRTESLSHILQRCPITHFERIRRHDRIVHIIAEAARKKGWDVQIEPRLRDADNNLRKPDLVLVNQKSIIIADVGVHWEGPEPLNMAARDKIQHYRDRKLETSLLNKHPNRTITHMPLILGARGGWWSGNNDLCQTIPIGIQDQRTITYDLLKGGWTIHRVFSTRIWENPR